MMRVLSVLHGNTLGGPHNRNAQVGALLQAERGIATTVLIPEEPGDAAARLRQAGLDAVDMPVARIRASLDPRPHLRFAAGFARTVREIRVLMRERGIDLVQINGVSNPHAAVAARREGIPVVWQILDTFPPMWFRRLMMSYVLRTAGAIMATGQRVAAGHPGAERAAERLVHFFPPVDTERFRPNAECRDRARERMGLGEDDWVIGNVSNLNPQKGHETFIRAAAALRRSHAQARFVILGQRYEQHAEYINGLFELARRFGLEMGQDLIVMDPGDDVAGLAAAFDVFWMTSVPRSEGIPTVVEEAMALGLPVVATDVGSIGEIVAEGVSGYLVPPYDPERIAERTRALLGDRNLLREMGERNRETAVERFSVASCAERHLEAYGIAAGEGAELLLGAPAADCQG